MKKLNINPFAFIIFLSGMVSLMFVLILTHEVPIKKCKKYIIEHASIIHKTEYGFEIDTCIGLPYYTDITIRMDSDSSYNVVFWGNRESFLWNLRLDKSFSVDIPYNRYKNKNVELDEQILSILKNI